MRRPVGGEVHVHYGQIHVHSDPDSYGPTARPGTGRYGMLVGFGPPGPCVSRNRTWPSPP